MGVHTYTHQGDVLLSCMEESLHETPKMNSTINLTSWGYILNIRNRWTLELSCPDSMNQSGSVHRLPQETLRISQIHSKKIQTSCMFNVLVCGFVLFPF